MDEIGVIFSGEQGQQIEQTVIGILKDFMANKFAAEPYKSRLTKWGGVNITDTDKDAEDFVATAKPFVFMSITNGSHEREVSRNYSGSTLYVGARHTIGVVLELCVTNRCRDAIKPLRDAVQDMIDAGYSELRALGLYETEIQPTSSNSSGVQLLNPHTLTCVVYTIPKP